MIARENVWPDSVPTIVLLIGPDSEALRTYTSLFEASGQWVARCTDAASAPETVEEIKPSVIVIAGLETVAIDVVVEALRADMQAPGPPVIALAPPTPAAPAPETRQGVDLWLDTPVQPETLLEQTGSLIERTKRKRASEPQPPVRRAPAPQRGRRGCPDCGRTLEWVERTRLYGTEYDYYRWCDAGCGLYCYNRSARTWVKLA